MAAKLAYHFYEAGNLALVPTRAAVASGRSMAASFAAIHGRNIWTDMVAHSGRMVERLTRRYSKPSFALDRVQVDGADVNVTESTVWETPFCRLIHFDRDLPASRPGDPKVLLVAPLSGHHATLLKGTVEQLLQNHDVYITDWQDARNVPVSAGSFGLDDYVDHVIGMLEHIGPGTNVMAVCQPSVPVLMAVSLMSEDQHPCTPSTMTLLGGPIDCRKSPTEVNRLATEKGFDWFRDNLISIVPYPNAGSGRRVYPGFLQLSGFLSMNLDRHIGAHGDYWNHLVDGNRAEIDKHEEFYDEYLAVMDLTEEFYLETIRKVFVEHHLPSGIMEYRGRTILPAAITKTALMTVEGGKDDITGLGQTEAAHTLCSSLPASMRSHHVEQEAGHYGIFSGSKFRNSVSPAISEFIRDNAASK